MTLQPFITEFSDWGKIVKGKYLLFDTDAIINIIHYSTHDFFKELKQLEVTNCFIHPVYIELMRTDKNIERLKRQVVVNESNFYEMPFTQDVFINAQIVQQSLASVNCFPSPADLYLSGFLAKYHRSMFLLTRNTQDFPAQLFNREGYVIFQDEKHTCTLSLLSINPKSLIPF